MSDNLKSILFAVATAMICSTLLTAAALGLKPYKIRNLVVDKQKNILKAVGLIEADKSYSPADIETMYTHNIQMLYTDTNGRILAEDETGEAALPLWLFMVDEQPQQYVIPINTRGLWGPIRGYMALEKDGSTISGFTVYKHSETPGLGGEIEQAWFQKNFQGKKITDAGGGFVSIAVAKGRVSDTVPDLKQANFVDGISGATLTGKFLTEGLKEILHEYEPVSIHFRQRKTGGVNR